MSLTKSLSQGIIRHVRRFPLTTLSASNSTNSTPASTPEPENHYQNAWLKSFGNNHVPTNPSQKLFLLGSSSVLSLLNTHRGDLVGVVGETLFSAPALGRAVARLRSSVEGLEVLEQKPRVLYAANRRALQQRLGEDAVISDQDIVEYKLTEEEEKAWLKSLLALPPNTLGHAYATYMCDHEYLPSHRYMVRFIDDPELAYVMQRYREVHDFVHILTDLPPTVKGELALKALEFLQTELPMNLMSVIAASPVKLSISDNIALVTKGLPWAQRTHQSVTQQTQGTGVLGIFYEKYWNEDLSTLRSKYGFYEQCPI